MNMINAMPMSGGIDYSLEEQDTGLKWIDGKKIYQKSISCGEFPDNNRVTIPHEINNLDRVIEIQGFAHGGNVTTTFPRVTDTYQVGDNYVYQNFEVMIVGDNLRIGTSGADTAWVKESYVTLRYTKTT